MNVGNHTLFCPLPAQSFHNTSASLHLHHGSCACSKLTAHTITLSYFLFPLFLILLISCVQNWKKPKQLKLFRSEWIINLKATGMLLSLEWQTEGCGGGEVWHVVHVAVGHWGEGQKLLPGQGYLTMSLQPGRRRQRAEGCWSHWTHWQV